MTPVDRLAEAVIDARRDDAARVLERLAAADAAALLAELDVERAAGLAARLEPGAAAAVVTALPAEVAAAIVGELPAGAAIALLRRAAPAVVDAALAAAPPARAEALRRALAQPARSAGALMDPDPPAMAGDRTAGEAIALLRARAGRFGRYLYVVDRDGALAGVCRLLDLIAAPPEARLGDLAHAPVVRVRADDPEAAVLAHPGWARLGALPVVDAGERLVGVIRDDVVRELALRNRGAEGGAPVSLAVSLAELFWLGLTGVTEGVARVVGREVEEQEAR